jgi:tRNA(Ile2) C34 agmatinyltransferase TiaS
MTTSMSPCPVCGQRIDSLARRCQHCETFLDPGWSGELHHEEPHRSMRTRIWDWFANH